MRDSTSPRSKQPCAQSSNSDDQVGGTASGDGSSRYGRPWVVNPEPMISTPSSRSGANGDPAPTAVRGRGRKRNRTGMSASGYITVSRTYAPWSSLRRGSWAMRLTVGHHRRDARCQFRSARQSYVDAVEPFGKPQKSLRQRRRRVRSTRWSAAPPPNAPRSPEWPSAWAVPHRAGSADPQRAVDKRRRAMAEKPRTGDWADMLMPTLTGPWSICSRLLTPGIRSPRRDRWGCRSGGR